MRIGSADVLAGFVAAQPEMRDLLAAVASFGLLDAWIGAGFVRNPVWDALHGRTPDIAGLADVDVVFFDPAEAGTGREQAVEAALAALRPGVPWSVRNQVRMHRPNADPPYRDTAGALSQWPETATAVAARLRAGQVEMLAPHCVGDLLGLATPATEAKPGRMDAYRCRVRSKG